MPYCPPSEAGARGQPHAAASPSQETPDRLWEAGGGGGDGLTHLLSGLLLTLQWLCQTLPCSCSNPRVLVEVVVWE